MCCCFNHGRGQSGFNWEKKSLWLLQQKEFNAGNCLSRVWSCWEDKEWMEETTQKLAMAGSCSHSLVGETEGRGGVTRKSHPATVRLHAWGPKASKPKRGAWKDRHSWFLDGIVRLSNQLYDHLFPIFLLAKNRVDFLLLRTEYIWCNSYPFILITALD